MSLLTDLCLSYSRSLINQGYRSILNGNKDMTKDVLSLSLKKNDLISNGIQKEDSEYSIQANNHPEFLDIHNLIGLLCETYKNKIIDKNLKLERKIELYNNSIKVAEILCEDLRSQDKYISCQELKIRHDEMFENCYAKAEIIDDITHILSLLEETNTNFIIKPDEKYSFYPIITDFLLDTITLEYSLEIQKTLIDALTPKFHLESMKNDIADMPNSFILYSKVDFIKQVGRPKSRLYLLHEYARKFKCDLDIMRELYKELLYWDTNNHPTALKSKKFNIKDVKPSKFILSQSRFVIDFS